jgi:hypothetical protein
MMEQAYPGQIDLFAANPFMAPGTGSRRRDEPGHRDHELTSAEAMDNARLWLARGGVSPDPSEGGLHEQAHLPGNEEIPEIYALCPGCEVHPGGGIYPAAELVRAEGCLAGERLRANIQVGNEYAGGGECHRAEREGLALRGTEQREPQFPSSTPVLLQGEKSRGMVGALVAPVRSFFFHLTIPFSMCFRLYSELERRVRRSWYFHRRRTICRQRLSQIASSPSWIS